MYHVATRIFNSRDQFTRTMLLISVYLNSGLIRAEDGPLNRGVQVSDTTLRESSLISGKVTPGQEGHGEDGFVPVSDEEIEQVKPEISESLECSKRLDPISDLQKPWKILSQWLDTMKDKLRHDITSDFIIDFYINRRLRWCYVNHRLKDIRDDGLGQGEKNFEDTIEVDPKGRKKQLGLRYGKVQMAITTADLNVYIDEKYFTRLPDELKAKVLLHEVMWHALGFDLIEKAIPLVILVNLIAEGHNTNRNEDVFSREVIAQLAKISNKSPFKILFEVDQVNRLSTLEGTRFIFQNYFPHRRHEVFAQLALGEKEYLVSFPNPLDSGQYAYANRLGHVYAVQFMGGTSKVSAKKLNEPNDLCLKLSAKSKIPWKITPPEILAEILDSESHLSIFSYLSTIKRKYLAIQRVNRLPQIVYGESTGFLSLDNEGFQTFLASNGRSYDHSRLADFSKYYPLIDYFQIEPVRFPDNQKLPREEFSELNELMQDWQLGFQNFLCVSELR